MWFVLFLKAKDIDIKHIYAGFKILKCTANTFYNFLNLKNIENIEMIRKGWYYLNSSSKNKIEILEN